MRTKTRHHTVTATEAAKNFGALVDRVRESGTVYQVESRGQVVAEIRPASRRFTVRDFGALLEQGPRAPGDVIDAIEDGRREARQPPSVQPPALSGRGGRRRR